MKTEALTDEQRAQHNEIRQQYEQGQRLEVLRRLRSVSEEIADCHACIMVTDDTARMVYALLVAYQREVEIIAERLRLG